MPELRSFISRTFGSNKFCRFISFSRGLYCSVLAPVPEWMAFGYCYRYPNIQVKHKLQVLHSDTGTGGRASQGSHHEFYDWGIISKNLCRGLISIWRAERGYSSQKNTVIIHWKTLPEFQFHSAKVTDKCQPQKLTNSKIFNGFWAGGVEEVCNVQARVCMGRLGLHSDWEPVGN